MDKFYTMRLDHACASRLGLGYCSYTAILPPGYSKHSHHYRDFTIPCEP